MIYRRFGRTELQMPVFSCGGMRYQQSWTRGARSRASQPAERAGHHRSRAGSWGSTTSRPPAATAPARPSWGRRWRGTPRASFKLQTKIRPDRRPQQFERLLEESFAALRTPYLDLFAFHGVNTPRCLENIFRPGGCYEVVERFRRDGRIRHVGFSTHGPTRLILEAVETGAFDYLNLHYYYVFQDNRPVLEAARRQDMGVFIISPTDKGGRLQQAPARLRELCAPLSPMVFNDLWCLAHPEIHTLSLGAARPDQFDEHMPVLPCWPSAGRPPARHRRPPGAAYAEAVGTEFARRWREGLPEWTRCPAGSTSAASCGCTTWCAPTTCSISPRSATPPWPPTTTGSRAPRRQSSTTPRWPPPCPAPPSAPRSPPCSAQAHAALYNPEVEGLP